MQEETLAVQSASYTNHSTVDFILLSAEVEHLVCADTDEAPRMERKGESKREKAREKM